MKFEIGPSSDDREAWMNFRRGRITATDVARLASSGLKGWKELRAEKESGESKFRGNRYTKHGSARESTVSDQLDVMLGMKHNTNVLVSAEDERMVSTPDLIDAEKNGVGDIKTSKWAGEKWDKVPRDYDDQLQWQMFTTGAEWAVLAVEYHEDFVPVFMSPHLFYRDRDEQRIEFLRSLAERFLSFDERTPMQELLERRTEVLEELAPLKEQLAEVEQDIEELIGERPYFKHVSNAGSLAWSPSAPRKQFDKALALKKLAAERGVEATKANLKDIEDEFTKTGNPGKPRLSITVPESEDDE